MKKVLFFIFISFPLIAQHHIIPNPVSYETKPNHFLLDAKVSIDITGNNSAILPIASFLQNMLSVANQKLTVKKVAIPSAQNRVIYLELLSKPNANIGNEGYILEVDAHAIRMSANKPVGLFYAMQTLRQLLPPQLKNSTEIAACKITDYPRFGWRGLMLDVSRHFFTKNEVMQYIDLMARYKFNVLHWHLTDDEGWRIEIKSLPKLTEVGAWRVKRYGRFGEREYPKDGEPTTEGGFYTQDEIKEVVKYAADRNITIVPEVDVPGHSLAALSAYPELSCRKEPKKVNPGSKMADWYPNGTFKMLIENSLNPSDEKVYEFLGKVFAEVATLFPNKFIHVGGDECYHGYWEEDASCKAFMQQNNLKDSHELQSYFMKRVEQIIKKNGKKMIGWDEILEGGLAPEAAVMSWRGMKGGIEAAKQGHEVVMSPTTFAYLDYTQGDHTLELPIYADLSLQKSYEFEPVPDGINAKLILGGQANLWTEQIPTIRHAFYMTYPRAFAIAETVWSTKESKNYDNFLQRVEDHFSRFDANNLMICKAIYDPIVTTRKDGDKLMCTISSDLKGVDFYYTIDNTFPDKFTPKYVQSFEIPNGNVTLKVVAYRNGQPIGRALSIKREDLVKRFKK
jgi:hexosaminidase